MPLRCGIVSCNTPRCCPCLQSLRIPIRTGVSVARCSHLNHRREDRGEGPSAYGALINASHTLFPAQKTGKDEGRDRFAQQGRRLVQWLSARLTPGRVWVRFLPLALLFLANARSEYPVSPRCVSKERRSTWSSNPRPSKVFVYLCTEATYNTRG